MLRLSWSPCSEIVTTRKPERSPRNFFAFVLPDGFTGLTQAQLISQVRASAHHLLVRASERINSEEVRQARLGQRSPAITLGIYTHVVGEDSRAAAAQLGHIVWHRFSGIPAPS